MFFTFNLDSTAFSFTALMLESISLVSVFISTYCTAYHSMHTRSDIISTPTSFTVSEYPVKMKLDLCFVSPLALFQAHLLLSFLEKFNDSNSVPFFELNKFMYSVSLAYSEMADCSFVIIVRSYVSIKVPIKVE